MCAAGEAGAAAAGATEEEAANMSLKADAEPNNNVSIEEEVSVDTVRVCVRSFPSFPSARARVVFGFFF